MIFKTYKNLVNEDIKERYCYPRLHLKDVGLRENYTAIIGEKV